MVDVKIINIPTWQEINRKVREGIDLTPIEKFIHENEPANNDAQWRFDLIAALKYAAEMVVSKLLNAASG